MPEQFDPLRHRVWQVEVTQRSAVFVIAVDADQAARVATDEIEDPDAEYFARQIRRPLTDVEVVPQGPTTWGRRVLTINEALDLIACPRPAPVAVATDELHHLGDWDWVRLAAATHPFKRQLWGVQVSDGRAVATDGHRLHAAGVSCPPGLWDPETMEPIADASGYPDVLHLLETGPPTHELLDIQGAWKVLRAAQPAPVSFPLASGQVLLDASQLAEALIGAAAAERVLIATGGPDDPVRLDVPDLGRTAVLMPLVGGTTNHDLGRFVRPLREMDR